MPFFTVVSGGAGNRERQTLRWMQILPGISPPEYAEIMLAMKESGEARTEWVGEKLIAAARRA
jgi:hypothetical protein